MAKKRKTPQRLTSGEISIMKMLWEAGEATLADAHRAMRERGETVGYTTVQTRLERLVEKGVVAKSRTRPAKYRAAVSPDDVSAPILDLLLQRVTGPVPLVAQLVQDPSLTTDDLDKIQRLIDEARKHTGKHGDTSQ
jgi:predicted transcriptional regulator